MVTMRKIPVVLLLVLMLLPVMLSSQVNGDTITRLDAPIRIEELETTTTVEFEEEATYTWIVYNNDTTSTYSVYFWITNITGGNGWEYDESKKVVVLDTGDWSEITETVKAPSDWKGDEELSFVCVFVLENMTTGNYSYHNVTKNVEVEVSLETWNARDLLAEAPLPEALDNSAGYFLIMILF